MTFIEDKKKINEIIKNIPVCNVKVDNPRVFWCGSFRHLEESATEKAEQELKYNECLNECKDKIRDLYKNLEK